MSRLRDKIVQKFNDLTDLELNAEDWTICRTRAGWHQRSSGAWSWFLRPVGNDAIYGFGLGSQWSATKCAKEANEVYVNIHGDVTLEINTNGENQCN